MSLFCLSIDHPSKAEEFQQNSSACPGAGRRPGAYWWPWWGNDPVNPDRDLLCSPLVQTTLRRPRQKIRNTTDGRCLASNTHTRAHTHTQTFVDLSIVMQNAKVKLSIGSVSVFVSVFVFICVCVCVSGFYLSFCVYSKQLNFSHSLNFLFSSLFLCKGIYMHGNLQEHCQNTLKLK